MSRVITNIIIGISVLLALAILGGLVWANTFFVRAERVEKDFLVPWLAARTFLQYGENPYSLPAAQRAQVVYYGKLASPGQDPLYLWLPMPAELFYVPFALVTDYTWARALWLTCSELALAAIAIVSLRLAGWRPPRLLLGLIMLASPLGVFGIFSLMESNAAAFTALALAGFLLALKGGHDELAGALLLVALGTPTLTILLVFFMSWWILAHRRWRILWGFLMALAILLFLSFLLIPDWVLPYITGLVSYARNSLQVNSVGIFASWSPVLGQRLGWLLAALLLLLLFAEWGATRHNEYRHLAWTVCLTAAAMPLMGMPVDPGNYVFFFLPLLLMARSLNESQARPRKWGAGPILIFGTFLVMWLLVLVLGQAHAEKALADVLRLLLPVLLIGGLYWIRWRFTRPPAPRWENQE